MRDTHPTRGRFRSLFAHGVACRFHSAMFLRFAQARLTFLIADPEHITNHWVGASASHRGHFESGCRAAGYAAARDPAAGHVTTSAAPRGRGPRWWVQVPGFFNRFS